MYKWFLSSILVLAFLLRVPFLDLYPIGFTTDEASFGYDAYSILKTGKDQWGHTFPLVLESFGDFKAPLESYLEIPFIAVMGLTKQAVRLPNALLGVGAIYIVYLLANELLLKGSKQTQIGLITAFLLTISPWHIQLSRGAFESNLTSFFLPLGVLLFLRGVRDSKLLLYSSIAFGLNLFSYHSAKVVTPLLIGVLGVLFWKELKTMFQKAGTAKKNLVIAVLAFAVFMLLTAFTFFQDAGRRASDVSIFGGALESQALDRLSDIENGMNPFVARIIHNKYFVVLNRFSHNYKSYYSFDFLFESGAGEGTYGMIPKIALMYWFELPLLLVFFVYIVKNRREKSTWIVFLWLLIAPIPASLTQGVGHAGNRAATMMPVLQIAGALGFYQLSRWVLPSIKRLQSSWRLPIQTISGISLVMIALYSLFSFVTLYVFLSSTKHAGAMLYGNMEVAEWLDQNADNAQRVVVSRKLSEPHIFIAFAQKWDPSDYQKETVDWRRYKEQNLKFLDQLDGYRLGKYSFGSILPEDLLGESTLIVGRPDEFPSSKPEKIFYYPDGTPSIYVVSGIKDLYAFY
jgi:4-amino-4-deoxy-L-arabinose transferase-like glycosyltransferase